MYKKNVKSNIYIIIIWHINKIHNIISETPPPIQTRTLITYFLYLFYLLKYFHRYVLFTIILNKKIIVIQYIIESFNSSIY